jgi:hypothetical protein
MFRGYLLRRNAPIDEESERPVIILFQTGTQGVFTPLFADLNHLPFEADDSASDCGGLLPTAWAWEDLSPKLLTAIRAGKGKIFPPAT